MALYVCCTNNPMNEKLEWDVAAVGTVCKSGIRHVEIDGKISSVLCFKMIEDNGETHECHVWGQRGVSIAPYVIKGRRVRITGKTSSEHPHLIRVGVCMY